MDFTERKFFFNEIEEKFPVESWKINNTEIWPYILFELVDNDNVIVFVDILD